MKLAAGVLIAVFLVATGWASEKVYQKIMKKSYYVELEKRDPQPSVKLPVGSHGPDFMVTGSIVGTTIPDDAPPGSAEKAKRRHETMKQMIAEKKYEFVKTFEAPPGGDSKCSSG